MLTALGALLLVGIATFLAVYVTFLFVCRLRQGEPVDLAPGRVICST